MKKPGTLKEIESLIAYLIKYDMTEDKKLLSKIYVDLGVTAGNLFKLKFEKQTGKSMPDPL